jgi:glucose-1-phosphate cytidylyltransferase
MKVIILAGGRGTRLGQLTESIPKPLIKIGEKPIIWHIMKHYASYGFKEFIICTGYKSDLIKSYFFHYNSHKNDFTIDLGTSDVEFHNRSEDWKITIIDTGLHTSKAQRIKKIQPYLDSDDIHMLTYADGLSDININELLAFHKKHRKMITITGVSTNRKFGEIKEKDGHVIAFEEKPNSTLINGGFMVFNNRFLEKLTPDGELEPDVLRKLSIEGELMVYKHRGEWACMDTYKEYLYLNEIWEHNQDTVFWKVW